MSDQGRQLYVKEARGMATHPGRNVKVTVRCATVPACPDGLSTVVCLGCGKPLDVHQPDAELPERMLATCETCKGWHLMDCQGQSGDVVVLLPGPGSFRKAPAR